MGGFRETVRKRWHSLALSPAKARRTWAGDYWKTNGAFRDIACRDCRKFDASRSRCTVSFGTPLRKCVVAAIEAHFHSLSGQNVLEIGYGRFTLARNLIRRSGGTWTGIDVSRRQPATIGRGGRGQAAAIPFAAASFDMVFGIQTFEHWGQKAAPGRQPSDYGACLEEILRVLKPGGRVYLDAPVHFHGHEMFIMGDVDRIRALFDPGKWDDLVVERWRLDYLPLAKYPPSRRALEDWPIEVSSYSPGEVNRARDEGSVWLLTFSARKRAEL